jgi:hypothetical protein
MYIRQYHIDFELSDVTLSALAVNCIRRPTAIVSLRARCLNFVATMLRSTEPITITPCTTTVVSLAEAMTELPNELQDAVQREVERLRQAEGAISQRT